MAIYQLNNIDVKEQGPIFDNPDEFLHRLTQLGPYLTPLALAPLSARLFYFEPSAQHAVCSTEAEKCLELREMSINSSVREIFLGEGNGEIPGGGGSWRVIVKYMEGTEEKPLSPPPPYNKFIFK